MLLTRIIASVVSAPSNALLTFVRHKGAGYRWRYTRDEIRLIQRQIGISRGIRGENMYKPSAIKRMNKHGWEKRISSVNGIKTLWRRRIAGRNDLSC